MEVIKEVVIAVLEDENDVNEIGEFVEEKLDPMEIKFGSWVTDNEILNKTW